MVFSLTRMLSDRLGRQILSSSIMRKRLKESLPESSPAPLDLNAKRVVVLAPHPDDELYGAGLLLNSIKEKVETHIVFITCGEGYQAAPGNRKDEALQSAERLKASTYFCGFDDGHLAANAEGLFAVLQQLIAEKRPDILLFPSFNESHIDHRTVCRVTLDVVPTLNFSFQCLLFNTLSPFYKLPSLRVSYMRGDSRDVIQGLINYRASTSKEAIETFVLLRSIQASVYLKTDCFWEPHLVFDSDSASQVKAEAMRYPDIYPVLKRPRHWHSFSSQLAKLARWRKENNN